MPQGARVNLVSCLPKLAGPPMQFLSLSALSLRLELKTSITVDLNALSQQRRQLGDAAFTEALANLLAEDDIPQLIAALDQTDTE